MQDCNHPVVMTTRVVLVTSCLVAMATLVAPQCGKYPNRSHEQSVEISGYHPYGDFIALILGIGGFALIVSFGFLLIRYVSCCMQ